MEFRVEEIGDQLRAIFDSDNPLHNSLLSGFLVSSKYFVTDILYDISLVEKGLFQSYAFENPEVYIELYQDHITIEPYIEEDETEIPTLRIPLERAKLLLLEWGVVLQQWLMKQKGI
ncbi:MAG TPA: hypothetical protein VHU19_01825 [Pyrinomonadaceae bacterium]|jgi:hypothetical protein|nr:hypothetical protein [Pyrinomonadaceae bacterium]